jgi:cell wall-associated NlpC family hydrolase
VSTSGEPTRARLGSRRGEGWASVSRLRSRRGLLSAVSLAALALLATGLALLLTHGSHSTGARGQGAAKTGASAAAAAPRGAEANGSRSGSASATGSRSGNHGATVVGGARRDVAEVADPKEASSYPAPASALHNSASAPAKAGEAIVAAGAPSDAEVKAELRQMHAAEQAAARTQRRRLTPVPGGHSIGGDGTIPIPASVPEVVQRVIAGANAIADFPYVFGGGHGSFVDNAYDCSGSVSYALAAGGLLSAPETSGDLESWGVPGPGRYITVLANAGHTYMYVDGVLFDTAGRSGVYASRWQTSPVDNSGYVVRHWPGL